MQFEISEVISIVEEFADPSLLKLLAIGEEMTTPDGRWEAFQRWLKDNRHWRKKIDKWLQLTPEAAYHELKEAIIDDSTNPAMIRFAINRFIKGDVKTRVINSVETLQTLYNERKGTLKNARRKTQIRNGQD